MARPITQLGRLAAAAALLWLSQAGASAAAFRARRVTAT